MCYYKNIGDETLTADKDIVVYKVTDMLTPLGFLSAYQKFRYRLNKTYTTDLDWNHDNISKTRLDSGFHSYKTGEYLKKTCGADKYLVENAVSFVQAPKYDGFISSESRITFDGYRHAYIIECVIPKGTVYYFNGTDYVSKSIRPIKIIRPPYLKANIHYFFNKYFKIHKIN